MENDKTSIDKLNLLELKEKWKIIQQHLKLKKIYQNLLKQQKLDFRNSLEDKDKEKLKVITKQFKVEGLKLKETYQNLPKKQAATYKKEKERLKRYLDGLKKSVKIPDIVIIVGQPEEINAVRECRKLGIRSITILDTNCDPTLTDLFVPANDDSTCSVKLLLTTFSKAIQEGKKQLYEKPKIKKKKKRKKFPDKNWRTRKKLLYYLKIYKKVSKKYFLKMPNLPSFFTEAQQ